MKKYQIQVCVTYKQFVEVEAENEVSAQHLALYEFDLDKAYRGESECITSWIEGEETGMENQIVTVTGHWVGHPSNKYTVNVSLGEWDGVEDEADRKIFYYTDGEPLKVGDIIAGDFVVTAIGE